MRRLLTIVFLLVAALGIFLCIDANGSKVKEDLISIPSVTVNISDSQLHYNNGLCFYRQQLYSGIIEDEYSNEKRHHERSFYKGKEEGWTLFFYEDGTLAEKRYYHLGEKDSVHTGWWQNGKPRFEYHFKQGLYNGNYKEWYSSGQGYKHILYINGKDEWGKGWRESGKMFMNYTMKDGRRYGIVNSNLCYTIKNGAGNFAETANADTATNSDSILR